MSANWMPGRGPKTRKLAESRLHHLLYEASMQDDTHFLNEARHTIPDAWHTLEMDVPCDAAKQKVTLYLDEPVIKMFRRMGKGYHQRINRILETWMQMRMAEKACLIRDARESLSDAAVQSGLEDVGDQMKMIYAGLWEDFVQEEGEMRERISQEVPGVPG